MKVKSLDGRLYNPKSKSWNCPVSYDSIKKLKEWGFILDEGLTKILGVHNNKSIQKIKPLEAPGLKKQLMPFQKEGLAFIEKTNGRVLIGDQMGLGKTIQSLAYLQIHPEKRPVLIICPASLKLNWKHEIEEGLSTKDTIQILSGKKPYKINASIIVINYDILVSWVDVLCKLSLQVIITDECHLFKSSQAKRTKAIKKLSKGIPHFIALSGTPVENRPIEIFNAVHIIDPKMFPSYWAFGHRYCAAKHNGFGWDFKGASNQGELHEKLTKSIMIRRLKKDVLKDLPDKIRSFIPIGLDNWTEYQEVEDNFIDFIKRTKGDTAAEKVSNAELFVQIEYLKQAVIKGKMNSVIQWIHDFLETENKLVVFATHKEPINQLMQEFSNIAVKIDGSVSTSKRDQAVQAFQNDPNIKLFIGNIKAAGVGLTLTASSNVAFIEFPWSPGELDQAEDRCHRIGQEDCVNVYYLSVENTIESKIISLLDQKRKVVDAVLDGVTTNQDSLLAELIENYNP
jgi:SWI/SNF-related matrix-associated actin-dependent regulator 1 of chromatin subfamily A